MGMAGPRLRFVTICMGCFPGVQSVAGVTLSHGYCRFHGLELMVKNGLATESERVELWARRNWILLVATILVTVALGVGAQSRSTKNNAANRTRPTPLF